MSRGAVTTLAALGLLLAALALGLAHRDRPAPRAAGGGSGRRAPERASSASAPRIVAPTPASHPEQAGLEQGDPAGVVPPPPAPRRPAVARKPAWSAPFEVVARDARSSQGLPFLHVSCAAEGARSESAVTDRDGRARTARSFEAGNLELTARDELTGERHELAVEHRPPPGGGAPAACEWPLAVGPTYGLLVDAPDLEPGGALLGRLVEAGPGGGARTWSSRPLRAVPGESQLWLRYPELEHEPAPGWTARLQVWAEGTPLAAEVPVPAALGVHDGFALALRARFGGVRGRVLDTAGRPVAARVVVLGGRPKGFGFDPDGADWLDLQTDEQGCFEELAVAPGTHRVLVRSNLRPIERGEVAVVAGAVAGLDFVLPEAAPAGDVSGTLIAGPGAGEPLAMLQLEAEDGALLGPTLAFEFNIFGGDPDGEERTRYAFEDLPAGRYRVRVVPLDGRTYVPAVQTVEVPAEGVDFTTGQSLAETTVRYDFAVTDAETGAPVAGAVGLWCIGGYWYPKVEELPSPDTFDGPGEIDAELLVGAPGYVPARVRSADAVPVGPGFELRIRLRRGYGLALLVADAEAADSLGADDSYGEVLRGRGVPGALVVADGRPVGSVGSDGVALIETRGPIERLRVEAPGWVALAVERFAGHARTPDGLGFVLMVRD